MQVDKKTNCLSGVGLVSLSLNNMETFSKERIRSDKPLGDSEVIAVREYRIEGTSPPESVLVRLGAPKRREHPDGGFECGAEIRESGRIWVRRLIGTDEFEALQLALRLIEVDLDHIDGQLMAQQSFLSWNDRQRRHTSVPSQSHSSRIH